MMDTLATGTRRDRGGGGRVRGQASTPRGGLVFQALRWHRPEYAAHRVEAQIEAMNKYHPPA